MLSLSRVQYELEYLEGFVFKGHSTVLAPIRRVGYSVEWHYVGHPDKTEFLDMEDLKRLWPSEDSILEHVSSEDLRTDNIRHHARATRQCGPCVICGIESL